MDRCKLYFLSSCIAIVMLHCGPAPTPEECEEVKNGKFIISIQSHGVNTIITREGKRQTEIIEGTTDTIHYGIRWLGDCEYHLHQLSGNNPLLPDSLEAYAQANPVQIKILRVEKDFYTFRAEIAGEERIKLDTAYRIK